MVTRRWHHDLSKQWSGKLICPYNVSEATTFPWNGWHLPVKKKKKKTLQVCASDKVVWCFRVEWEARCGSQRERKKKKTEQIIKSGDSTALTCNISAVQSERQLLHLANSGISHKQKGKRTKWIASKPPTQERVCLIANKGHSPNPLNNF